MELGGTGRTFWTDVCEALSTNVCNSEQRGEEEREEHEKHAAVCQEEHAEYASEEKKCEKECREMEDASSPAYDEKESVEDENDAEGGVYGGVL